ncbi:hypothetical protein ACP275_12G151300 [Erythranthe tilingii]
MGSRSTNSSGSSHNRSNIGSRNGWSLPLETVTCRCGFELSTLTSWSEKNPGRKFRACPNYTSPSCCGYFEWVDEEVC